MGSFKFNVNTSGVIHLTAKLEQMNKYAFPAAVRSTLSDAAFAMKQKNISESAERNMTVRNKTVFKKFTGVERAKFNRNIESMSAAVGFIDKDGVKGSKVAKGMEANEAGGVDTDGLMYMKKTRTSNSPKRLVRRKDRYSKGRIIKGRVRTKKSVSNTLNMISSFDEKRPTFVSTKKGRFLVQVTGMSFNSVTGKHEFTLDFLMRDRKKHNAKARATHFNKQAAEKTQTQIESFYQKNAEFQMAKIWK